MQQAFISMKALEGLAYIRVPDPSSNDSSPLRSKIIFLERYQIAQRIGFHQVSRQLLSGGAGYHLREGLWSGDSEPVAQGGDPLDMDRPSSGTGSLCRVAGFCCKVCSGRMVG